eukprot:CAMPEP_0167776968 /NCGR_PEP_ID=MMETSP0111_2-20121227/3426_1 /TAXON_ID=91324 /ORGANISM="Lotharella globosa, Strain CCCM811" /LENGTH=32 /DNA_ID= /DNA_START= /DNA_END= /DNA_ORIENTATION=
MDQGRPQRSLYRNFSGQFQALGTPSDLMPLWV